MLYFVLTKLPVSVPQILNFPSVMFSSCPSTFQCLLSNVNQILPSSALLKTFCWLLSVLKIPCKFPASLALGMDLTSCPSYCHTPFSSSLTVSTTQPHHFLFLEQEPQAFGWHKLSVTSSSSSEKTPLLSCLWNISIWIYFIFLLHSTLEIVFVFIFYLCHFK